MIRDARLLLNRFVDAARHISKSPQSVRNSETMARRSLIWLLNRTSERRCHDPRDKFFALYGMVPGIQKVFPVDYEKSESDVELEVTAFILNHCIGGAVIFATFSLQTHPFLPSWVPSYRNSTVVYNPGQILGSSGRLAPCLQQLNGAAPAQVGDLVKGWSEDMSRVTLSIFARKLGTVRDIFSSKAPEKGFCRRFNPSYTPTFTTLPTDDIGRVLRGIREPDTILRRIARALASFSPGGAARVTRDPANAFGGVFQGPGPETDLEMGKRISTTWDQACDVSLRCKVFFTTNEGLFGIGVGYYEVGDILITLPETPVPMILRQTAHVQPHPFLDEGDENTYYQMVGTAFVDGLMEPLFLDDSIVSEVAGRKLEAFLIR